MELKIINLPDLGEGVTEGEIIKIKVSEGDKINMDQILLEVMTDKASMEIPSSVEGTIQTVEVFEGDIVSVGAKLFTITIQGKNKKSSKPKETKTEKTKTQTNDKVSVSLSDKQNKETEKNKIFEKKFSLTIPSTRKLAEELNLPLDNIQGSGPQGEIKREDLLNYIKNRLKAPQNISIHSQKQASFPQAFEEKKREPLRGVRRLMFDSMTLSKTTIPHFTIGERAQVKYLMNIREEMKNRLKKQGLKIGWLPFFVKALIPVLKEFPIFNSIYDLQNKEIIFKKDLNVGFAVDSSNGLLVPVLKKVQNNNLLEIIKETQQLAEAARQGTIQRENLVGASITLSNLGSLGGHYGTPIINPPEMAIMGVYSLFKQVIKNPKGVFEEKPFINFSITCDHRFIDGATAARFLKSFINKIEEPSLLLLD